MYTLSFKEWATVNQGCGTMGSSFSRMALGFNFPWEGTATEQAEWVKRYAPSNTQYFLAARNEFLTFCEREKQLAMKQQQQRQQQPKTTGKTAKPAPKVKKVKQTKRFNAAIPQQLPIKWSNI